MVAGEFHPDADQVVIGSVLADELGLSVGRPMRIQTTSGEANVRVVGIFELGSTGVDGQWVISSLRTAQSLLGRPGDITSIDVTVEELFEADAISTRVSARTGLAAESWMQRNGALLTALDAQSQSTILIRLFTLLAVAMGIASVLAVTVVQRRGQIGILRAMGVRARVILMIFLWQGALLGIVGAMLGTGLGMLVGKGLGTVVPFEIVVDASTAGQALAISLTTGILAALWPAASASRMDPAAAIRGDG
jgi:lipoprotein-releasing system permease protein